MGGAGRRELAHQGHRLGLLRTATEGYVAWSVSILCKYLYYGAFVEWSADF